MTNAKLDENRVPAILALSSADGATLTNVGANPSNQAMKAVNGTTYEGYSSASTDTSITPVQISSGVVNGDFALQPTFVAAQTTTSGRWINGTASGSATDDKYKWSAITAVTAWSVQYNNTPENNITVTITTKGAGGYAFIDNTLNNVTGPISLNEIPLLPNTSYKVSAIVKTSGLSAGQGAMIRFYTKNASGGIVTTEDSSKTISTSYVEISKTFTTGASTVFGRYIIGFLSSTDMVDGCTFSVKSMKLETVTSITNSSSSPALYYPSITAVTSTDNIDQSNTTSNQALAVGSVVSKYRNQQFLPTKKNYSGITFRRGADVGTFTGNITIQIQLVNGASPSGTDLITPITIPNATWEAITVDTDYTVTFPSTLVLTPNGTNKYYIIFGSSTADASNYATIRGDSGAGYANGISQSSPDFVTWNLSGSDLYFKTLYSKNTTNLTVSTDTQTVSVTAPTVDGWANGTVIDVCQVGNQTPLTLASGANNIYVSSNGPSTADSTVDPSLQATFGAKIHPLSYTTSPVAFYKLDENRKVAFMAVSAIDGVTPVEVYCDSDGKLLINSN